MGIGLAQDMQVGEALPGSVPALASPGFWEGIWVGMRVIRVCFIPLRLIRLVAVLFTS